MTTSLMVQYGLVGLAVCYSIWVVANKQFPAAVRRARIALAIPLIREQRARWLRRIGHALAPDKDIADAACGGCDNCEPTHKRH